MRKPMIWMIGVVALSTAACQSENSAVVEKDPNAGFDLSAVDSSYAACDDFFHFTAQGWLDANPIPETESSWGKFSILAKENKKRVRGIFDDLLNSDGNATPGSDVQLVGDLYRSGMDSLKIEELKFSPLDAMIESVNNASSLEDWFARASNLQMSSVNMPISVYVSSDDKNASMNVLHMYQSGLGLPDRSYYLDEDSTSQFIRDAYVSHVANMLTMYGVEEAKAKSDAQAIFEFERSLAEHQLSRVQSRDPDLRYNKMTVNDLKALSPNIPFDAYLDSKDINPSELIVTSKDYVEWLSESITSWNLEVLKAYSTWHVINSYANNLHYEAVAADFAFYETVLNGRQKLQPRWRRIQDAMGGLNEQIGHLYVDQYFPAEYKERVEGMVEDLRSAFRVRIQNLDWMSNQTKGRALEKLEAFTYKIGYPDEWSDWSDLEIENGAFVKSLQNLSLYTTKENLAEMGKPVDKGEWFMGAHIVNAYYNPNNNEVVFPAGILQPPFFMPEADDAINYGAIGGVIGHEFTHGFDDQGSKYDKDGNLNDWWTEDDRARFEELTQRVVNQYDGYEALPDNFVSGQLTLGENIADLGGLTLAYHAYQMKMEGQPEPEPIGGFTDDQRVFLGWAQVWQVHYTDEQLLFRLKNDYHSPGPFRVIGPMSNMPEFWQTFGCGEGSPMHLSADEHAVIW